MVVTIAVAARECDGAPPCDYTTAINMRGAQDTRETGSGFRHQRHDFTGINQHKLRNT